MTSYLLTALSVIFLSVIVSFIAPDGRLKKSINFTLRLICITVLVMPLSDVFQFEESDSTAVCDYEYICSVYSENQSKYLSSQLSEEFGVTCQCSVVIVYENGSLKEDGVAVYGNFVEEETIENIREYLEGLGYINITVNETT